MRAKIKTTLFVFVLCCSHAVFAAAPPPSIDAAVRAKGYLGLRSISVDLNHDGQDEMIVAAVQEQGVMLTVWSLLAQKDAPPTWQEKFRGRPLDGEIVLRLEARQMVEDDTPEIVFEVREESPDEILRHLVISRWQRGALTPIFDSSFSVEDLLTERSREGLLAFGPTSAGYRFFDVDADGVMEIGVRRDLKVVRSKRAHNATLRVVVGAQETVFRYQQRAGGRGEYFPGKEQFFPYVEEVPVGEMGGSSQWLPPELEARFGRKAVADGVDNVFKDIKSASPAEGLEFSADDLRPPDAGSADAAEELAMQRDPAPKALWGADGDLNTAWCEGVEGPGVGQWWEARFDPERSFRMMRLILGDVSSKARYQRSNRLSGLTLVFSSGDRVYFDRQDLDFSGGTLAGFADYPLGEGHPGQQTLVFFSKPIKASWVRVEISQAQSRGREDKTCISEVKFYASTPSR